MSKLLDLDELINMDVVTQRPKVFYFENSDVYICAKTHSEAKICYQSYFGSDYVDEVVVVDDYTVVNFFVDGNGCHSEVYLISYLDKVYEEPYLVDIENYDNYGGRYL